MGPVVERIETPLRTEKVGTNRGRKYTQRTERQNNNSGGKIRGNNKSRIQGRRNHRGLGKMRIQGRCWRERVTTRKEEKGDKK